MIVSITSYLIRSCISLVLLYLFFTLFLSKDRFLKYNRFYLIFSLVFSLVIPLFSFPTFINISSSGAVLKVIDIQSSYYQIQSITNHPSSLMDLNYVIISLYLAVSTLLLIRFSTNFIRLQFSKYKNPSVLIEGRQVVLINQSALPYSFFSTVFVNEKDYRDENIPRELLHHEFAHIDQHHSFDIIFIELIRVIFWFNPVLIYYKKAIKLNHEYLADNAVTTSISSNESYPDILLNIVFRKNSSYLASSFNYSFTKKRLLMITKTNFSKTAILKRLFTIPLFILAGLLVLDAQDSKPVSSSPPPPPPPPFGYNSWWAPVLAQHKVSPDPSKSWYSQTLFETGEQFSIENKIVTLKDAYILAKSVNDLYRIITARSATHDLSSEIITCQGAKIETYKMANNTSTLINTEYYKDLSLRLADGLVAPPPPPPPSPPPPPAPSKTK